MSCIRKDTTFMQNVYFDKNCITVEDGAFDEFCRKFQQINAGGGLVRNNEGRYLLIYRHNIWDLPKGKQEPDEAIEECALREVREETGLNELVRGRLILVTHHTYRAFGLSCLKHTYWYEMQYEGTGNPVPQEEEDITSVEWVSAQELPERLEGTYPSIRDVFTAEGLL